MVYRGKPGLGCALCRKRRLTCDRRRPSCSQCLRVQQECTGYWDPNTLRVQNQTEEVTMKARARATLSRKPATTDRPTSPNSPVDILPPPISDDGRAMSHVFTYYVGTVQDQGSLWYLPKLLTTNPSSALQATIKAVGVASMARMHKLPKLRRAAVAEYGLALRATNEALRDEVLAKSDSTLGAVVLLSTYEMITSEAKSSEIMRSWMNHVQGATSLLELRGEEQLDSESGFELFTIVRLQNALSGVFFRYSGHNSSRMKELSRLARSKRDEHSLPIESLYTLLLDLNDLSLKIEKADYSVEALGSLLGEALHLETDLRCWAMSLSPRWQYTVIKNSSLPSENDVRFLVHGDSYHVYHDLTISSMWNHYRQTRIIVSQMIRSMALYICELRESPECRQMVSEFTSTINQLVDDVCASVAYHFLFGTPWLTGAIRLSWPLLISAICTENSATHAWILQTFDTIAAMTGFQQPLGMLQRIRDGSIKGLIPGTQRIIMQAS
ncbi:hypothetical protein N7510_007658 [Penicillium lagena]|uniref:uncharacterized protein n=1 Tax=Penicillium lagena TaxID=94218 RepID=UPI002540B91E|nr:uncharacterized protein N7510_007658 [Penicillium lagena]KAJ5610939.1 hypothetical protein N7510_007658 [Penicillium lagena]